MPTPDVNSSTVKVWDPLIRVFHWSLAFFFLLAFITEDDWETLHVQAGYLVSFLIGFRLLWGLVGTRHARFLNFVKSPAVMLSYLKSILKFKIPHYLGHNPLGAAMVITLLMSITLLAFSGMVLIAGEGQGPLAATFLGTWGGGWMEKVHEFLANFTLLLVVVHVSGVVFSSFLDGENLVKAMVTGRKKVRSHWEDVIPPPARESESQVRAENRGSAISSTSHGQ